MPTITEQRCFQQGRVSQRRYLQILNNAQLTGKEYSRFDQWKMEKTLLQPLQETRYEMRKIKQVTVMKNGHVYLTEDQHYYSVPFELIGKKLNLQYSRSVVDIYHKYQLVATHKRLRSPHNYSTIATHMPPQHRYVKRLTLRLNITLVKCLRRNNTQSRHINHAKVFYLFLNVLVRCV